MRGKLRIEQSEIGEAKEWLRLLDQKRKELMVAIREAKKRLIQEGK